MFTGRVRIISNGFSVTFIKPRKRDTHSADQKLVISTPVIIYELKIIALADTSHFSSKDIAFYFKSSMLSIVIFSKGLSLESV